MAPASAATVEGLSASSVSHRVGGPTRGVLASTMLLPQSLELVPVVISVSGVTIVVTVAVVVLVVAMAMASATMTPECEKEWKQAREQCAEWLQMKNPPRGITGGYKNVEQCAKGEVREECGGNRVDHGRNTGKPGRRW